jgi:DNA-binding LacI/PurR family transcriptional regulator
MASLLEQASELDAVVAANDYIALGTLEALTTSKLPRRIAVVGFDNIAETSFSMPAMRKSRLTMPCVLPAPIRYTLPS